DRHGRDGEAPPGPLQLALPHPGRARPPAPRQWPGPRAPLRELRPRPLPDREPPLDRRRRARRSAVSRPIKVLMFMGYYVPNPSGYTIYAQRLAEGLVERGHQVTVLCSHHLKETPLEETLNGVRVVRSRVLFRFRKGAVMPLFWYDLRRLLRAHDVFHRHLPGLMDAYVSTRLAKALGKPVLMTHH